ncbi:MAG: type I restriction-modification system subunit M N-terminal domain-containing protein [Geodermatophilaceae bacterium]
MAADTRRLVDKLWSYCHVLRDDGVSVIEYTEQLTYLLFLKMAHERDAPAAQAGAHRPGGLLVAAAARRRRRRPRGARTGTSSRALARQPGTLGVIFRKAQNRIQDPAKLKRLIVDLIDKEDWSASGCRHQGRRLRGAARQGRRGHQVRRWAVLHATRH